MKFVQKVYVTGLILLLIFSIFLWVTYEMVWGFLLLAFLIPCILTIGDDIFNDPDPVEDHFYNEYGEK